MRCLGFLHDIYYNYLKYDNMFFENLDLPVNGVQYENDWTTAFQKGCKVTSRPVVGGTRDNLSEYHRSDFLRDEFGRIKKTLCFWLSMGVYKNPSHTRTTPNLFKINKKKSLTCICILIYIIGSKKIGYMVTMVNHK